MKIAVASNGLDVSPYFESCTNYNCFSLINGKMVDYRNLPILPLQNYSLAELLVELGVDTLLVGCLTSASRAELERRGITVLCGAQGGAKQTVEDFMNDTFIACDGMCDEYRCAHQEEVEDSSLRFG